MKNINTCKSKGLCSVASGMHVCVLEYDISLSDTINM